MDKIKVTHLGEDYSTIEINGLEFEASRGIGIELLKVVKEQKRIKESLANVLDYIFWDEELDFRNQGEPEKHIFRDIERVNDWLES